MYKPICLPVVGATHRLISANGMRWQAALDPAPCGPPDDTNGQPAAVHKAMAAFVFAYAARRPTGRLWDNSCSMIWLAAKSLLATCGRLGWSGVREGAWQETLMRRGTVQQVEGGDSARTLVDMAAAWIQQQPCGHGCSMNTATTLWQQNLGSSTHQMAVLSQLV